MLDDKVDKCFYVFMRTTIDIPDPLFREVKARAAYEGKKMKDLITGFIEAGLHTSSFSMDAEDPVPPPPIAFKKDSQTTQVGPYSNADLMEILEDEDALQNSHKS